MRKIMTTVNEIFPELNSSVPIAISDERHADCVDANPCYKAPIKQLTKLVKWIIAGAPGSKLLKGPTGSGKTELAILIADRMNLPLYQLNFSEQSSFEHLFGSVDLVSGEGGVVTAPVVGPVVKAYTNGGVLLLDEVDKAPAELQPTLFAILEGKPVQDTVHHSLLQNNGCIVLCTGNTSGQGLSHAYSSSQVLDAALRGRMSVVKLDYPEPQFELEILEEQFPMIPSVIRNYFVKLGGMLRQDESLEVPFSPRTLVKLCQSLLIEGINTPLIESFESEYMDLYDDEVQTNAIRACWDRVFGELAEMSLSDMQGHFDSDSDETNEAASSDSDSDSDNVNMAYMTSNGVYDHLLNKISKAVSPRDDDVYAIHPKDVGLTFDEITRKNGEEPFRVMNIQTFNCLSRSLYHSMRIFEKPGTGRLYALYALHEGILCVYKNDDVKSAVAATIKPHACIEDLADKRLRRGYIECDKQSLIDVFYN
jgi:cobaltochelatase CobS